MIAGFVRLALVLVMLAVAQGARAHPHVWVDARAEILFQDGAVVGVRHHWTFDEYFSSWAVQGLDTDGDGFYSASELQPLARDNITGLEYYDYYTFAGAPDGDNLGYEAAVDPSMVFEDGRTTLNFTVLFAPAFAMDAPLEIEVGDPEFYSEMTFSGPEAVTLENAPQNCTVDVSPPGPLDPAVAERLSAIGPDVVDLPEDLEAAARSQANLVTVACPEGAAQTALAATERVASMRPQPFSAPPVEPDIGLGGGAQTGFFGWVNTQQQAFYRALTEALSAFRDDWTAFWVLGGLSFLYGIFHAVGPGHGKLVISSYMLANESQVRRGIVLSALAGLMQAAVAIGFVLVAAGLLRLTATAMSGAANWAALGSYLLIAVLGAYLVARKVLGGGHAQAGDHDHHHHHHGHAHHHDQGHGCQGHAILPEDTKGDWREMAGVVLAVGLRPCSGALVVLVFALTQGVLEAGIAATLLMSAGTALTVSVLAVVAVGFKGAALRVGGGMAGVATGLWWLELAGAAAVMGFGLVLLFASL